MSFFYLDCYLPLSGPVLNQALEINRLLVNEYASLIDFKQSIKPHLTVFMGLFPDLPPVQAAIEQMNQTFMPFSLDLNGFRLSPDGYVFWEVAPTFGLVALHEKVIIALNPLRNGLIREKYLENIDSFSDSEQENIREFGFPWVMQLFKPHLTLGRINASVDAEKLFLRLGRTAETKSFEVDRLELGQVGDNGTVITGRFCRAFSQKI